MNKRLGEMCQVCCETFDWADIIVSYTEQYICFHCLKDSGISNADDAIKSYEEK